LLAAQRQSGKAIVAPSYRGTRGTPVLFMAEVFSELRTLGGDAGARDVVTARPERVAIVEFDVAMPADVDTPEDLARLHVQKARVREEIRKTRQLMDAADYAPDAPVAPSVHLATQLRKPLLIEGHAGVGKTEIAKVMARMLGTNLIRLQCYEGLD